MAQAELDDARLRRSRHDMLAVILAAPEPALQRAAGLGEEAPVKNRHLDPHQATHGHGHAASINSGNEYARPILCRPAHTAVRVQKDRAPCHVGRAQADNSCGLHSKRESHGGGREATPARDVARLTLNGACRRWLACDVDNVRRTCKGHRYMERVRWTGIPPHRLSPPALHARAAAGEGDSRAAV